MKPAKKKFGDLIKTIYSDDEINNYSEESDGDEYQPTKQKSDFDPNFDFFTSAEDYSKDTWNDLTKYVKRKAKSKTDDKIKKARAIQVSKEEEEEEQSDAERSVKKESDDEDQVVSEEEVKDDTIKERKKKVKNSKKSIEQPKSTLPEDFFEDVKIDFESSSSFYEMNLSKPLLKAIEEMKFVHPTPIQTATIPYALLGRDICGCAATGTGKTAAYMLPTLERLIYRPKSGSYVTRVLVLVPTRELGVQVYQVSKQICQFTSIQIGLSVGGLDLKIQENILRKNPDIVIATPGRLIDHLKSTPTFSLDSVEILILDEADRMLDEHFAEQMKEIMKQCSRTRQTMLFSATMSEEVENLATMSLVKPIRLFVDSNRDVAFNLRQEFIRIRQNNSDESQREAILAALVCRTFKEHCMIFVQTKKQAHRLHILLGLLGLKVGELHGNLTQPQRLESLEKFKERQVDFLVATDVAARGLDIHGVQTVINYVMPFTVEHYIHRVGRTARAGRAGVSVSLAGEGERKIVKEVVKRARNPVKSRVIPGDILEKYRAKIEKLEPQLNQIMQEEYEERLLSKAENQANRVEKVLKGESEPSRPWFQTKQQRKDEKERLTKTIKELRKDKEKTVNKTKKKGRNSKEDPEKGKLDKAALIQAKAFKKSHKLKKINAVYEDLKTPQKGVKRKRSNFDDNFADTSNKKVKSLRYEANKFKKNNRKDGKGKAGKSGKTNPKKGKVFGKPKQKMK